ncbi:MAG: NUDIX domain-containing protein [Clostridiales bacterium]|nr:NUDIX domain-containing protein [Clostridiales bacterium]
MEYKDYICKDQDGNILVSVDGMNEETLSNDPLFTHCLAVVKVGDEYLLGRNKWRNRFEIFGGCAEKGETARECIVRECNEELGFDVSDITYIGAMKILLKPDYFSKEERIELGGLYGISLPDMNVDSLFGMIKDKDEITQIALYSKIKDNEPIALIDEKLLSFYE